MSLLHFKYGDHQGYAYAELTCRDARRKKIDHPPHAWTGDDTIYGPYFCWGYPYQGPKHRAENIERLSEL